MKKVARYEAEDGQLFETAEQAESWDRYITLRKWYESGHGLTGISSAGIARWLEDNQARVMLFYMSTTGHAPDGCSA